MNPATKHVLGAQPLTTKPGQPLRVAVYSRVAEAIVSGKAPPGTMLPTESEVGEALGVSRTVVREALMLLEEDQLITTRRGIGRFVASEPAKFGLERIAPFDELLRSAEPDRDFTLSSVSAYSHGGTEFSARGLDIDDDTSIWFWEHLVSRDGQPIAILQEHVVATDEAPESASEQRTAAAALAKEHAGKPVTLLSLIRSTIGTDFGPGEVEIATGVLGATRGKVLGVSGSEHVLVLTQKLYRRGEALYLGKYLVLPNFVRMVVRQSSIS